LTVPFIVLSCPLPHSIRIEVREGIQHWIQPGNLFDMSFGQLKHGYLASAQKFQLPHRGHQHQFVHGRAAPAVELTETGG
jgi:hypothetical protein